MNIRVHVATIALVVLAALYGALALGMHQAHAAQAPVVPPYAAMGGQVTVSATSSSSRVVLPASNSTFGAITVFNAGAVDAFIAFGDVTITATTSNTVVKAGTAITLWVNQGTYVAGITASGSASLVVYQATGPVNFIGGGGTEVITAADPCATAQKSSAAINVATATTTSLVAVSGSKSVYVCGYSFTIAPSAVTADVASFEYGTGASCSSPVALTGTYGNGDLTSAAPVVAVAYGGAGETVFAGAPANGLCVVTAGTAVNVQGVVTYVQQ